MMLRQTHMQGRDEKHLGIQARGELGGKGMRLCRICLHGQIRSVLLTRAHSDQGHTDGFQGVFRLGTAR